MILPTAILNVYYSIAVGRLVDEELRLRVGKLRFATSTAAREKLKQTTILSQKRNKHEAMYQKRRTL
jgi:hypothetical protein